MVNAAANRSQIDSVINNYGSTVTIYVNTPSVDAWGTITNSYDGGTATVGVPDSLLSFSRSNTSAGVLNNASQVLILKGQEAVSKNDKITYDGKDYYVLSIQEFALANVVLAKQVALEELNDNN